MMTTSQRNKPALFSRIAFFLLAVTVFALPIQASAQETGVSGETAYILNSFMFLICGFLVMWMGAGFAMLEAGLVRSKNTVMICLKNIVLFALACIMYYLVGYNLMYVGVNEGGVIGTLALFYNPTGDELALINAEDGAIAAATKTVLEGSAGYASMSDWFFQMVFVATAASIVSGTLAERIKLVPFLVFTVILTGLIYPVQGAWSWGGGWLSKLGFSDFAGSSIVHSVGGWAALTGAIILGPRSGKYDEKGRIHPMPGSNLPLATLGTFILWFGWFGFNGGSQLALSSALDASAMSLVCVNTALAASAGVVAAMALSHLRYGKIDLTMTLNGAIAGLVAITAGPDLQNPALSMVVGAVGGAIIVFTVPLLDKLKIDDVVGAIPAHLFCGIWGTLAVAIFGSGDMLAQLTGIAAIGAYTTICSGILWLVLKHTMGIRCSAYDEREGLDLTELGMEAYPDFVLKH